MTINSSFKTCEAMHLCVCLPLYHQQPPRHLCLSFYFRSKEVSTDFIEHFAPFKFTYMLCKDDRATE